MVKFTEWHKVADSGRAWPTAYHTTEQKNGYLNHGLKLVSPKCARNCKWHKLQVNGIINE